MWEVQLWVQFIFIFCILYTCIHTLTTVNWTLFMIAIFHKIYRKLDSMTFVKILFEMHIFFSQCLYDVL